RTDPSAAVGPACDVPSIWPLSPPSVTTQSSEPSTSVCVTRENPKRSPTSPQHEKSSSSSTQSYVTQISINPLDTQHSCFVAYASRNDDPGLVRTLPRSRYRN